MATSNWRPSQEEQEVIESVWFQIKGACQKLKEETKAPDQIIRKMLLEISDRYYSEDQPNQNSQTKRIDP